MSEDKRESLKKVSQIIEDRRRILRHDILDGMNSGGSIPGETVFKRLEQRAVQLVANRRSIG